MYTGGFPCNRENFPVPRAFQTKRSELQLKSLSSRHVNYEGSNESSRHLDYRDSYCD